MKEYINVGTDTIAEECFYPIINSNKLLKPAGGFWCTDHLSPYYNEWMDFIVTKPLYFARYMGKDNPFLLTGAVLTMKEDSRLFCLDNPSSYAELEQKYKFNFEELSEYYDAIYFDIFRLYDIAPMYSSDIRRLITVNTLLLFNLDCIDSYKKARITLEPFDYSYDSGYGLDDGMQINVSEQNYQVEGESPEYLELLEDISRHLKDIIFHLKVNNREVPSYIVVEMVRKELMARFSEKIKEHANRRRYDEFRVSNSLAIKAYRNIK